jgi:hypothetical protein
MDVQLGHAEARGQLDHLLQVIDVAAMNEVMIEVQ